TYPARVASLWNCHATSAQVLQLTEPSQHVTGTDCKGLSVRTHTLIGGHTMLVLSRKIGERIHIGEDIFIEVRKVAGNRVTLAVNAPQTVRILRGELFEAARSFDVLDDEPQSTEQATTDTV